MDRDRRSVRVAMLVVAVLVAIALVVYLYMLANRGRTDSARPQQPDSLRSASTR